ncbi:hypothetical protein SELMODRAFT_409877 [Selaginella moellendorffii]|uniref:Uncharacterized protein n=1 Tax=Selaginella moellendorffii TaxID=88036 RepID=D8RCR7_SELML|nr:hypothetical protein SELMODRAFT_409877 [Selaginella moellendorffii]
MASDATGEAPRTSISTASTSKVWESRALMLNLSRRSKSERKCKNSTVLPFPGGCYEVLDITEAAERRFVDAPGVSHNKWNATKSHFLYLKYIEEIAHGGIEEPTKSELIEGVWRLINRTFVGVFQDIKLSDRSDQRVSNIDEASALKGSAFVSTGPHSLCRSFHSKFHTGRRGQSGGRSLSY